MGNPHGYGIGWSVAVDDGQITRVSHGGGSIGRTTSFMLFPQDDAAVAVVGNLSQAPTGGALPVLTMRAFLDPDELTSTAETSGPDISGSYDCIATADGADVTDEDRARPDGLRSRPADEPLADA